MYEYLVVTTGLVACFKASFQKVYICIYPTGNLAKSIWNKYEVQPYRELTMSPNEKVQVAKFYCLAEKYGAPCTRQGVIAPTLKLRKILQAPLWLFSCKKFVFE